MADCDDTEWFERIGHNAADVEYGDVPDDVSDLLADVLPTMRRSMYWTNRLVKFLADPAVPYDAAAKLFAAIKPAPAPETAAFLCRPDMPAVDAARIVALEHRTTVLRQVAELPSRDPAVYEAVVSGFAKTRQAKSSRQGVFAVLSALLTNPDVPLVSKTAAAAVPSADTWSGCPSTDTPANSCWVILDSSEQLQAAVFDSLQLPDRTLLCCAPWRRLTAEQLRVVFAALQRYEAFCRGKPETSLPKTDMYASWNDPHRLPYCLWELYDHVAATDEFLSEVDDWFDKVRFDPPEPSSWFFQFAYRKHRRQKQSVDPAEFWASHPTGPPEELAVFEWSLWTRIGTVPELVEVLAEEPERWAGLAGTDPFVDLAGTSPWPELPLEPLISSASSTELLDGLDAAAAAGVPEVLAVVEKLVWCSASYEALTFDVLRRLCPPVSPSPVAAVRLLELFAATLGPDSALWRIFETVSVPDASVGEILDLTEQIVETGSAS